MGTLRTLLLIGTACQSIYSLHRSMTPKERHHIFGEEDLEKVPEYWLDKPRKSVHPEHNGHFLYNISYRGKDEVFRLQPHERLFSDEFHMISRDDDASAIEFSLADQECTYQGESIEAPTLKIALVGCGERMHGMIISTEDGTPFLISPHSKGDEHIIHKRSIDSVLQKHDCLFNLEDDPYPEDRLPISRRSALFDDRHTRLAVMKEDDLTIELAVFADDAMWRHFVELYGSHADAEMHRFILAAVNNIDILYGQRVINPTVNIKIVRYEVLKTPPPTMVKTQHQYGDVDRLLDAFCDHQAKLNPLGDDDPKHWDHALLFSGYDLYRDGLKTVAGYAPVKGMCSETRSCTINEGLDFGSVFVVTHEMGHSLGMYHDGDNECDLRCCIMSPSVGTGKTQWSSCSVKEFSTFVGKLGSPARAPNCLRDLPTPGEADRAFFKDRESPGQQFTLGEQCAVFHGECWKHELRDGQALQEVCEMVWCGNGEGIIRTAHPALEGTNCGPNLWCRNGQCVPASRSLPQIDGQWGTWNESPSSCRAKCSECEIYGQMQLRRSTRLCNRPAPNNGGRECVGDDARGIVCDSRPCGGMSVDAYASWTCGKLKNDPDTPNPQLNGVGLQFEQAPCKVWCQLDGSNNIRTVSNFPDGTPCGEGNYCIKGECRPLLCNGNAVTETESECPFGPRFRIQPSPATTTPWTTTTNTTPPPRTPRPAQATTRRMSNLQRFMTPQGNLPAARRLQMTTRPPSRTTHRLSGSTPARFFATTTMLPTIDRATRRPPMWSLWSEWSECLTVACGEKGIKVRIRRCVGDQNQYIRDDTCRGHNRETARCMGEACSNRVTRRMPLEMPSDPSSTESTTTVQTTVSSSSPSTTSSTMTTEKATEGTTTTAPLPPPPSNEDDQFVIELQDDVQEISMTTPSPVPSPTTINPRLAPLLKKGAVKVTTTTQTTLVEGNDEEYFEPPSESPKEEFLRQARVTEREERMGRTDQRFIRKIKGDSPGSPMDDEVINVSAPTLDGRNKKERPSETSRKGDESTPLREGFQLQEHYISNEDDVIDVPEPRSNRGGRRIKNWDDGRDKIGRKTDPEVIDVPAHDYRVRSLPISQYIPDPLNPSVMRQRNVAITQLLPYNTAAGSLETIAGPNQPLNPALLGQQDPLNLRGGLENLAALFKPLFPGGTVPTAPPPPSASTLPQGLIPIQPSPERRRPVNEQRTIGKNPQPIREGGKEGAQNGRIRVFPGPPPSEDEIIALLEGSKVKEGDAMPKSPFDKMEELESLPSPVDDDRLPLEDLDDGLTQSTSTPPPPLSTTTTTMQTTTTRRTLPPIYGDEETYRREQQAKRAATESAARVPKEIRDVGNQRKDYIIVANSPSSLSALPSVLSSLPGQPRVVPLYGTPPNVQQQQSQQGPYVAAATGPSYAGAKQQPTGVRTIYVIKGGTYGNVLANGAQPSFTTAAYARASTPSVPKYRTAEGYNTPAKVVIYGENPSYSTHPYVTATPSYSTPSYSTPAYTTPPPTYSTPPPPTYPTTPPYKPPPPEWGPWSPCSVTCGNGTRTRKIDSCGGENSVVVSSTPTSTTTRVSIVEGIESSTPTYVVEPLCVETEECVLDPCFRYSEWSDWNGCSKECGMGFSLRRRTCVLGVCPGPFSESKRCEGTNCEIPSIWGEWGSWSECSTTCGVGTKSRERVCQSKRCLGMNREARRCQNPALCYDKPPPEEELIERTLSHPILDPVTANPVPAITNHVDNDWLSWNTCSTSCGLGTQIRRHRNSNRVQHRSCFLVSCNDFGL